MANYRTEKDNGEWYELFYEILQAKKKLLIIDKKARKLGKEAGKWKKR